MVSSGTVELIGPQNLQGSLSLNLSLDRRQHNDQNQNDVSFYQGQIYIKLGITPEIAAQSAQELKVYRPRAS